MTAAVLAPLAGHLIRLTDLGRLRVQETERVAALRTELTRCGAQVVEEGDTLTILPSAAGFTALKSRPTTTTGWRCVSPSWD